MSEAFHLLFHPSRCLMTSLTLVEKNLQHEVKKDSNHAKDTELVWAKGAHVTANNPHAVLPDMGHGAHVPGGGQ